MTQSEHRATCTFEMKMLQQIPWPRIFAEGIAIVVSILLAFWIQAWWEERQLRDEEQRVLTTLAEEFTRLEYEASKARSYYTAILSSLVALVEIGDGTRSKPDNHELDRLFGNTLWYGTTREWTSGELDSIISSGDLALISDGKLRQDISRWTGRLSELRDAIELDRDAHFNRYLPYLSANINVPALATLSDAVPGSPDEKFEFPMAINISSAANHRELLNRQEFLNLLWDRVGLLTDVLYLHLGYSNPDLESRGTISSDLATTINVINQKIQYK